MNTDQYKKLSQANYLHITGQLEKAVQQYTELQAGGLQEDYELTIQKAIALTQLNNFESALKEVENAIVIDRKRYEGLFRRGIINFNTAKIKSALIDFQEVQEKIENDSVLKQQVQLWIGKCNAELNNSKLESLINQETVQQQPKEVSPSTAEETKKNNDTSKKIAYTWYQTDSKIGIEIKYALTNPKDVTTDFTEKTGHISFPTGTDSTYTLDIDFWAEIQPESANVTLKMNQVEIVIEKKVAKLQWKTLLSDGKDHGSEVKQERKPLHAPVNDITHSYPSSNKNKKDWSKIDQEIEEDMKQNKDDYFQEEDPSNALFKQIYANADENTRRAMIKSYQTSGGTVLSTNWDEVKAKDYEGKDRPSPPKGQKWGKWEK